MAAITSSAPALMFDGFGSGMPRMFIAATTYVSSAIVTAGFWAGVGDGSRGLNGVGLRIGDVLMHIASTNAAIGGRTTLHSVIASTADQASTSGSTGWNAAYNVTVASAT